MLCYNYIYNAMSSYFKFIENWEIYTHQQIYVSTWRSIESTDLLGHGRSFTPHIALSFDQPGL